MPIRWTILFRALIVAALSGHVFYMYCTARAMQGEFGFSVGTFILSALFAAAMLIPLLWAVWLADLPEAIALRRARKRFARHQCPSCGYPTSGSDSQTCPECGAALVEPPGYQWSWRTVRRFVVLNILAWVIGISAGEAWMSYDEMEFRQFAAEMTTEFPESDLVLWAHRRWPADTSVMSYETSKGFTAEP